MRKLRSTLLVTAASALFANPVAHAAALVNLSIQASKTSGSGYSSTLSNLNAGDTVYLEVTGQLAAVGATNTTANKSITNSTSSASDGIISLKFDLTGTGGFAISSAALATPNTTPSATVDWSAGSGPSAGTISGTTVGAIRPIVSTSTAKDGTTVSSPDALWIGSIKMGSSNATVSGNWTSGGSGSFKINGGSGVFISSSTEGGADPYVHFNPLTLNLSSGIISLSGTAPTSGSSKGNLTVTGHYNPASLAISPSATSGYAEETGIAASDAEYFGLRLSGVGADGTATDLNSIINTINSTSGSVVTASAISSSAFASVAPFSNDQVLLSVATGSQRADQFIGFDFTSLNGVSVSEIDAVPEPASLGILGIGALAMLRRQRRKPRTPGVSRSAK